MHTTVYIDISVQTSTGPQRFGRFEIGNDLESARQLFGKLKGSAEINLKDMLYIEFVETRNGLPANVDILTCDLQELGINAMLITQEIFRLTNLKGKK
jgi:hypothetical protein